MEITIALGSNTSQEKNIRTARQKLREMFPDISFSQPVWTAPVGIISDKFLNCTASFRSTQTASELISIFKTIEREMGDSHENHTRGTVIIDIDLISHGTRQLKKIIWK